VSHRGDWVSVYLRNYSKFLIVSDRLPSTPRPSPASDEGVVSKCPFPLPPSKVNQCEPDSHCTDDNDCSEDTVEC